MKIGSGARFRTHAKVNLFLRVLGLRPDGYHEIETILQVIDLHDELDVSLDGDEITIEMELGYRREGELPTTDQNLIRRAAEVLVERAGGPRGVGVRVVKNVPIGAGLGGGSANAAGALVILADLWGIQLEREDLMSLAGELGSDVPFCLEGGVMLATERGEKLTTLPSPDTEMWFVLGGMNYPLSTREVYGTWDSLAADTSAGPSSSPLMLAFGAGDLGEVGSLLHNDLERAAFALHGELEGKKESMARAGALGAAMTGSGPTMFGLCPTQEQARAVAARVEDDFDWVEVVPSRHECIQRLD